jgi:hypothetical protein
MFFQHVERIITSVLFLICYSLFSFHYGNSTIHERPKIFLSNNLTIKGIFLERFIDQRYFVVPKIFRFNDLYNHLTKIKE